MLTITVIGAFAAWAGTGCTSSEDLPAASEGLPVVVATIPLAETPEMIAAAPALNRVYTLLPRSRRYAVIDTAAGVVVGTPSIPGQPLGIGATPDGRRLYISQLSSRGGHGILVIDPSRGAVITTLDVTGGNMTVSPDGRVAYVIGPGGGMNRGSVLVLDTTTDAVTASIPLVDDESARSSNPLSLAVSPDGQHVYVVVDRFGDEERDYVAVIDTRRNTVAATIPIGDDSIDIAVAPDGRLAYVTHGGRMGRGGTVDVLDLAAGAVSTTIAVDGPLYSGAALTPDGRFLYVASQNLAIVDTASNTVAGNVPGAVASSIAFGTDGRAYLTGADGLLVIGQKGT
jgi:YVTN family beta-propeller protein